MASPLSALFGSNGSTAAAAPATNNSSASSSVLSASSNEQMFLQLLVSQLKNQDPLNPVDGTQFVSQLSQFSELEQLIAIRGDIESAANNNSGTAAANANAAAQGTSQTSTPSGGNPAGTSSSGTSTPKQN